MNKVDTFQLSLSPSPAHSTAVEWPSQLIPSPQVSQSGSQCIAAINFAQPSLVQQVFASLISSSCFRAWGWPPQPCDSYGPNRTVTALKITGSQHRAASVHYPDLTKQWHVYHGTTSEHPFLIVITTLFSLPSTCYSTTPNYSSNP